MQRLTARMLRMALREGGRALSSDASPPGVYCEPSIYAIHCSLYPTAHAHAHAHAPPSAHMSMLVVVARDLLALR